MAYDKVTIDLTGDPHELNDSLKRSESLITQYGKKIQAIMNSVGKAVSYSLNMAARTVSNSIVGFKNLFFTFVDLGKAAGVLNTQVSSLNSIFQNGVIAVSEYVNNLYSTWQLQKDLSLSIQLTGKAAGYTSEQMGRYAEYLEKVTKYSKEASLGAEMILTHFRDIRGKNFLEATKAAQDYAEALHIDLAQAASEVGNALQNPIEAMDQLASRNIFFTREQQKAIQKALEANKVLDAQAIILKKLNDSFGGSAQKAMGEFSNKLEQIKNRLYTVAQAIAEHVIRRINKLIGVTADGTSKLEAYITKIESFVPVIANLIDTAIAKMQEWADVIKDKLAVAFTYFTKITIVGVTIIQTALQNLSKIVRIVTATFEQQLEKMKQTWLIIWTRVIPASLGYVERLFDEITSVKIPNFFIRMMQKILTTMTKGLVEGVLKLIDFASGRWIASLGIKGVLMGNNLMLKFMKAAIEAPMKLGGVAAKVFNAIFGLSSFSIEAIGAAIGSQLAKSEAEAAKAQQEQREHNFGADAIENFFKILLPEIAQKNSLKLPDFSKMFERNETDLEKALREEITSLKEQVEKNFGDNKNANQKRAEELKQKVQQLLAEQERANKEFKDKFGRNAPEPGLKADNNEKFDREEARRAKERADEEERRRKKLEAEGQSGKDSLSGAVSGLEEFWYKQNSELEDNTKAVKENTLTMYEAIKQQQEERKQRDGEEVANKLKTDILGNPIAGPNAFMFVLSKNQKKVELDRKKQERADEEFQKRIETRRRNDIMFRNREAKPAIREQNKFGINTEQQRKQAQIIMEAQMRRGKEQEVAREKMQELMRKRRGDRDVVIDQNRRDAKRFEEKNMSGRSEFDKYVRSLLDESKGMNDNTKQVAEVLKNIGAI